MNEHHLLQPAVKEQNCISSDTNIFVSEIYRPLSLDNIPSAIDRECRFTSNLTTSSTNTTHEVSQAANHNCRHYKEYRHLGCTNNTTYSLESPRSKPELSPGCANNGTYRLESSSSESDLSPACANNAIYSLESSSSESDLSPACANNAIYSLESSSSESELSPGCANNGTYRLESSSSESELSPSPAKVDVDLETELLSLVAELLQDRLREAKHCQSCCHNTYSKKIGCWNPCEDPAKNNPSNDCVHNRQKGNTTSGRAQRKQSDRNKDQEGQLFESRDAATITQVTADCPVSRCPRFPELNVDVDLEQSHLFPGENPNVSSNFINLSATKTGKALLLKEKPSNQLHRESKVNYIPAKHWERQKLTTVFSDHDIPLRQNTENYWETAARGPIINPFQLARNENRVCWEQSGNNTSGGNNIACGNYVHMLNKSSFHRLHPVGNYISNRKNETAIDASVSNEPVAADCSDTHPYLGMPLNDPEKKINNELVTFNKLITRRLASSENIQSRLQGECSAREENMLDGIYQTQDPTLQFTEEPHQSAGSIHMSLNPQKGKDNAYLHLLEISKYIRRNEHQKGESQSFLKFSKPIPAGNFNEIIQTDNGNLAVFPDEKFCNGRVIKSPKLRRLMRDPDMKEASLCHMAPSKSKNQPSFHSWSMRVSSADNKDMRESDLSYPLWNTKMQPAMELTRNAQQYINDDSKSSNIRRLKHSRICRRRCGIGGTACCHMCLPEIPLDVHTSFGDKQTGNRNSMKKHLNSRSNRSKHLTPRSANNRLGRTYGRSINSKSKQSVRRGQQYSRSTSPDSSRRRISKYAGNRGKRRRSTSTDSGSRRRRSNYAGSRGKRRRSTSTDLRRRSRGSTRTGCKHRNVKPRSNSSRLYIRQSMYKSKVKRQGRPKGTGLQSGRRRTRKT